MMEIEMKDDMQLKTTLEAIKGDKQVAEIAQDNNIHPCLIRRNRTLNPVLVEHLS
jgi:hypothetical protein